MTSDAKPNLDLGGTDPSWEQMLRSPDVRRGLGWDRIFVLARCSLGDLGCWKEVEHLALCFSELKSLDDEKDLPESSVQHNALQVACRIRTTQSEYRTRSQLLSEIITKLQAMNNRFQRAEMIVEVTAESVVDFARGIGRGSRS